MSDAKWSMGTTLSKGGVSVGEVTSINGLNLDSDEIEVTHLESPGGYEEVIQSIRRTGTVTIEGNFVPDNAGQAALMADYLTGSVDTYIIAFPDEMATEWEFDAFVKAAPSTEAGVADVVSFSAELRVTGEPSLNIDFSGNLDALTGVEENGPLDALVFSPAFAVGTYEYVVAVNTASTFVRFTVTGADEISVNGEVLGASPATTGDLPLGGAGSVTKFVIARREPNNIPRRYTVHVARA